ncbi:MAG TPA: hypothetical protein VKA53_10670 [Thermoanaerobaculia bacterium]|nr:hypothetical protein [Thermoanaerobaculia bacterium]
MGKRTPKADKQREDIQLTERREMRRNPLTGRMERRRIIRAAFTPAARKQKAAAAAPSSEPDKS